MTDAPLEFSPQDNLRKAPSDALYPLFMKLEFTKLIDKYGLKPPADIPAAEEPVDLTVTAEAVTTVEKAKEYLSLFRKAEHVTLLALPDLSGVIVDFVAGESTAVSAEFYFSRYEGDWNALLRALFSDDIKKVSHNVKDLQRTLLENDLPIEGFIFDTALAGYLLDATAGKYDIASLFAAYFHQTLAEPKHLDPDAFSMLGDTAEAETAFHVYTSAVDALYEAFAPELEKRELHELYYEVELPLCAVLARMEHAGMRVDANALAPSAARWKCSSRRSSSTSMKRRAGRSTSTPPSSSARCFSTVSACRTAKRRRPAGQRTRMCSKSCAGSTPSSPTCCSTVSTPS